MSEVEIITIPTTVEQLADIDAAATVLYTLFRLTNQPEHERLSESLSMFVGRHNRGIAFSHTVRVGAVKS